jgi:riboflavin kinase / FMN adenylyltransferase
MSKSFKGIVVKGRQEGRKIGFPTANIEVTSSKIEDMIEKGVWVTQIKVNDKWYRSACSYGPAPVYNVLKDILEVHILDFDQDIYGLEVEVDFAHKIRDISNFESIEELITQIQKDCETARNFETSDKLDNKN